MIGLAAAARGDMPSTSDRTFAYFSGTSVVGATEAPRPLAPESHSSHFDGRRFFNPHGNAGYYWHSLLRRVLTARPRPWPRRVENVATPCLPTRLASSQLALTFINHITFLIQLPGLNILTDPVYSERVSPLKCIGPRRVRAPGLPFEELPPIDFVLVSHDHYDHLDTDTLRRLEATHRPHVFTGLGNGDFLRKLGMRSVHELDWWQYVELPRAAVTLTPARHWSGRRLINHNRTLWGGFHVQTADGTVYFAGDTGYCRHFKDIRHRLGSVDLALLPIGAYSPRWYEGPNHMDPEEAVRAHLDLGARVSVATHFGCFRLSDEGIDEPLVELAAARRNHGVTEAEFTALETGETRRLDFARETTVARAAVA